MLFAARQAVHRDPRPDTRSAISSSTAWTHTVAVGLTMAASLTLLPACSRSRLKISPASSAAPCAPASSSEVQSAFWARWSQACGRPQGALRLRLRRRRGRAILSLRLGHRATTRRAPRRARGYDLIAKGFSITRLQPRGRDRQPGVRPALPAVRSQTLAEPRGRKGGWPIAVEQARAALVGPSTASPQDAKTYSW